MGLSCSGAGLLLLLTVTGHLIPSYVLSESVTQPRFAQPIGNQEVIASRNAALKCVVENLGEYQVAWIHLERQMILTIHDKVITSIPRFRLVQDDANTWVLHIAQVQRGDGGLYMCQVNTAPLMSQIGSLNVLEAPEIVDANSSKSEVSVASRDNVTLTCAARGVPEPTIQWTREDGRPLRVAASAAHRSRHGHRGHHRSRAGHRTGQRMTQLGRRDQYGREMEMTDQDTGHMPLMIKGSTLNLVHVTPSDMGAYLCIAKNEIPPTVSKRIQLFVEFKPMIWVPNQLVDGVQGFSVTLQCRSEAHPPPIVYWMKKVGDQERLIIDDRTKTTSKYDIKILNNEYETEMLLTIHNLNASDFGSYKCVCKNYIGEVDGSITLNEIKQPTTEHVTTESYRPWPPITDIVTFRNGDVYLPDEDGLEDREIEEEIEREKKRYGLSEGYNWEQRMTDREAGKSSAVKTSPPALLLLAPAFLTALKSLL